jgi:6-phosphogluconolactonase
MPTRRRFLQLAATLAATRTLPGLAQHFALAQSRNKPRPAGSISFVYFGSDPGQRIAQGIYRARFDSSDGNLTAAQLVAQTPQPSFLAVGPDSPGGRRCLYAVNAESPAGKVSSFLLDPRTGALSPINQVASGGADPTYIALDATGRAAFVANYAGSTVATYRIAPTGALIGPIEVIDFKDPRFGKRGPNVRQSAPHPHSVYPSPDNRFLIVSDLGSDEISVFPLRPDPAHLGPPAFFSNARAGSGPRHIDFHPNNRWVYSINELDSTIDQFLWTTTSSRTNPQGLLVKAGPPVSTIAPGFSRARNAAAEIAVSPGGHYVYASNRGEDTLVVFSVAPTDGALTLVQRTSSGGRTPRNFALDPTGHWLLCGNQDSANVAVFRRDPATGRLIGPTQTIPLDSPTFTLFV